MGPVNWLAVCLAALAALGLAVLWYGPLFGRAKLEEVGPGGMAARTSTARTAIFTIVLLLLTSSMMGHMFTRVGAETLAVKPWLYFMMSGGIALFFVLPAVTLNYMHQRVSTRLGMIDGGYWLVAYLTMGLVFWIMG
jgi:hypothetical protein